MDFTEVDNRLSSLQSCLKAGREVGQEEPLHVGIDLGTAYIVVVVLDRSRQPVGCALEFSQTVKDGLVVDFLGATETVKRLVKQLEEKLGRRLQRASIAVPPGTEPGNCKTHCYVIEGAGLEVDVVLDEPVAANAVLGIDNGVIVDIGGGTTGLALVQDGEIVYTADEATGGTHVSLVLAGNYRVSIEEAEEIKMNRDRYAETLSIVRPVLQKMASIVARHIAGWRTEAIYLVGGTCCLEGIERVFAEELAMPVYKPANPFLVTPLGIALSGSFSR